MIDCVRLLLVDDHTLLRESLVRYLAEEPAVEVVADCATVAEARQVLAREQVDLVLLDFDLGEGSGAELLAALQASRSPAHALMLTAGMTPGAIQSARAAGAAGIILKQSGTRQLLDAIREVARGGTWWDAETLARSLTPEPAEAAESSGDAPARSLTDRQRLVLRGILDGLTNKEIAARLESSETSVKASIQELFAKGGVRTRSQLVRVALERFAGSWLESP